MSQDRGLSIHPALLVVVVLVIGVAVAVPLAAVVFDDDGSGTGGPTRSPVPARTLLYGLRVVVPLNEAEVSSPFTVAVESSGANIAMPEDAVAGALHYVLFVDRNPFTAAGQVVPVEAGVYHFAEPTLELTLDPGDHSLVVVLADNDNVRTADGPAIAVDVTVLTGR